MIRPILRYGAEVLHQPAAPVEGITALLATINRRYKLKNSGIQITGLP